MGKKIARILIILAILTIGGISIFLLLNMDNLDNIEKKFGIGGEKEPSAEEVVAIETIASVQKNDNIPTPTPTPPPFEEYDIR